MSYTSVYKLFKTRCTTAGELNNGWLSAPALWNFLAQRYLGWEGMGFLDGERGKQLWDLAVDPRVPVELRLAHVFTFDNAYVPRQKLIVMAEGCKKASAMLGRANHWHGIGYLLDQMALDTDHRLVGAVLNCTSVNDVWGWNKNPTEKAWDCVKFVMDV